MLVSSDPRGLSRTKMTRILQPGFGVLREGFLLPGLSCLKLRTTSRLSRAFLDLLRPVDGLALPDIVKPLRIRSRPPEPWHLLRLG